MRVLVACEESQTVTKAFREKGCLAYSCDILPCSGGHPEWHIKKDVLQVLKGGVFFTDDGSSQYISQWDLIIAHPPCTYFANAGLHYLKTKPERVSQLEMSFAFLLSIWNAPCNKIAVENPIGWLNTNWSKPTQIIQPYFFGDPELKTTCLWLKGLPPLEYKVDDDLFGGKTSVPRPTPNGFCIRKTGKNAGKKYNYYWRQGKSAKRRSKTFPGIAKAMAEQWGQNTPSLR